MRLAAATHGKGTGEITRCFWSSPEATAGRACLFGEGSM